MHAGSRTPRQRVNQATSTMRAECDGRRETGRNLGRRHFSWRNTPSW